MNDKDIISSLEKQLKIQQQRNSKLLQQVELSSNSSLSKIELVQLQHQQLERTDKIQLSSNNNSSIEQTHIKLDLSSQSCSSQTLVQLKNQTNESFQFDIFKSTNKENFTDNSNKNMLLRSQQNYQQPYSKTRKIKPDFDIFLHDLQEKQVKPKVQNQTQLEMHFLKAQIEKLNQDIKQERQNSISQKYKADIYLKKCKQFENELKSAQALILSQKEIKEIQNRDTEKLIQVEQMELDYNEMKDELDIAKIDNEQNFDIQSDLRKQVSQLKSLLFNSQKEARMYRDMFSKQNIEMQKLQKDRNYILRKYTFLQEKYLMLPKNNEQ